MLGQATSKTLVQKVSPIFHISLNLTCKALYSGLWPVAAMRSCRILTHWIEIIGRHVDVQLAPRGAPAVSWKMPSWLHALHSQRPPVPFDRFSLSCHLEEMTNSATLCKEWSPPGVKQGFNMMYRMYIYYIKIQIHARPCACVRARV